MFYMVLPFVVALIEDDFGNVLIGRHPNVNTKPYPGFWDLPGGKLEPLETLEQCIIRELLEELGVRVTTLLLHGVFHHGVGEFIKPIANGIPSIGVCFKACINGLLVPTEQADVQFASAHLLRTMRSEMTPWTLFFLKEYI